MRFSGHPATLRVLGRGAPGWRQRARAAGLTAELDALEVGVLVNNVGISYAFPQWFHELTDDEVAAIRAVLQRLMAAGMDSLPGGGAEILDDEIRNRISPFKNSTEEWLEVMRQAHALGMKSTATMVFGFQETSEHILLHLDRIRSLQDETGGFTAFITWPFQADGTRLKLRDDTSPFRYLRMQALARLSLAHVPGRPAACDVS